MTLAIGVGSSPTELTQPWAVVIAALVGAVVAGLFALWQSIRSARAQKNLAASTASAQQELEKYKSDLGLLRTQLELSRQTAYDFRVQRLTPFLEALNSAIVDSYSAIVGLPMLSSFSGHIPALLKQRDSDMKAWFDSMEAMSRL